MCIYMNSAVQEDVLYRQRDDAKKRAVLQGGSYEDFQNMVSVAHLRPINDTESTRKSTAYTCTDVCRCLKLRACISGAHFSFV